jgi:hypothetical protein
MMRRVARIWFVISAISTLLLSANIFDEKITGHSLFLFESRGISKATSVWICGFDGPFMGFRFEAAGTGADFYSRYSINQWDVVIPDMFYAGVAFKFGISRNPIDYIGFGINESLALALSLIAPISYSAQAFRIRRRLKHAIKSGLCRTCGYDLRASKDRCPECGQPIL